MWFLKVERRNGLEIKPKKVIVIVSFLSLPEFPLKGRGDTDWQCISLQEQWWEEQFKCSEGLKRANGRSIPKLLVWLENQAIMFIKLFRMPNQCIRYLKPASN